MISSSLMRLVINFLTAKLTKLATMVSIACYRQNCVNLALIDWQVHRPCPCIMLLLFAQRFEGISFNRFAWFASPTYPVSRRLFSCALVRRRGSPLPSEATASSSSKGGAINRSLWLIGRFLRPLTLFVALLTVTFKLPLASGCGRTACGSGEIMFIIKLLEKFHFH